MSLEVKKKKNTLYLAFLGGEIPLAKTNKSQKKTKQKPQKQSCSRHLDASRVFLRSLTPVLKSDRWSCFCKPYCPQISPWILHQTPAGLDYETVRGESEAERMLSQATKLSLKTTVSS